MRNSVATLALLIALAAASEPAARPSVRRATAHPPLATPPSGAVVRARKPTLQLAAAATASADDGRLQKLAGDVAAAIGAALCVTPLTMIVDVAITKAASGEVTLAQALLGGAVDWLTKPLEILTGPVYQLCLFVYICTYSAANIARAVCELYLKCSPVLPVLVAGTLGNMISCVYKDARLAEIFGKAADERAFPLAGYLLFVLRDVLANAGGFTLPPFVEPLLEGRVADPKTTAQLLVPAAINLVSSPVHLLGLSLYNNPSFGPLEHVAGVAAVYVSVTVSRVMKGFCAYGLGGVSNTALRAKFGSG